MKKLISILVLLFVCSNFINPLLAQSADDIKKEIHSKAMKEARKEAKKLKKEGFKVAPGQLPMDKQIENTWVKRYESDDKGNKLWFVSDARAVGETHTAAKMQANEVARVNLASQIGSEVAGLIKTNIANEQLSADDAASITETIATFESIVGSKLGRIATFFEADRTIGTNSEVFITMGYSYEAAIEMSKDLIRQNLKEKANIQTEQLENILDF